MLLVSVSTGVLGAALLGAGAVMVAATSLKPLLDELVIALGVAMLLISLLGVVGSLRESRCLLRAYAAVLLLTLLALLAGCLVLGALGAGSLGGWLDQGWSLVQEQGLQITREEFQQLVGAPPPCAPPPSRPATPLPEPPAHQPQLAARGSAPAPASAPPRLSAPQTSTCSG